MCISIRRQEVKLLVYSNGKQVCFMSSILTNGADVPLCGKIRRKTAVSLFCLALSFYVSPKTAVSRIQIMWCDCLYLPLLHSHHTWRNINKHNMWTNDIFHYYNGWCSNTLLLWYLTGHHKSIKYIYFESTIMS